MQGCLERVNALCQQLHNTIAARLAQQYNTHQEFRVQVAPMSLFSASVVLLAELSNPGQELPLWLSGVLVLITGLLCIPLFYFLWAFPVLRGIKAANEKGVSPHWMWFGVHPVGGWVAFLVIRNVVSRRARCQTCGKPQPVDAKFCATCGTPAASPGTSASLPVAAPPAVPGNPVIWPLPAADVERLGANPGGLEPTGYWGTFIVIAAATFLPFGLGVTWLISIQSGIRFGQFLPVGMAGGLLFGLTFGGIAATMLRGRRLVLRVRGRDAALARIQLLLAELGYHSCGGSQQSLSFRPSFRAGLLAGRMNIFINDKVSVVVGPAIYIWMLERKLLRARS